MRNNLYRFIISCIFGHLCFASHEYKFPIRGAELIFPRDHGAHPDYKTEWWYLTGHFKTDKDEYGFQLTFFRSASSEDGKIRQSYMAHAAVLNKTKKFYLNEERFNQENWNAGAAVSSLNTYNGNWFLSMEPDSEQMRARFSIRELGVFYFDLIPQKEKVLFGDRGYSQKGKDPKNASYYITFPRLQLKGKFLNKEGLLESMDGQVWMDHEFSSSHLSNGQIGWNWASLQFEDQTEIMVYSMRRKDGKVDPNSVLYCIDQNGRIEEYKSHQFSWTPIQYWKSKKTGGKYPIVYELSWHNKKGEKKFVKVKADLESQEFVGAISNFNYWEGSCSVFDENNQKLGLGYTEMTGYDRELTF